MAVEVGQVWRTRFTTVYHRDYRITAVGENLTLFKACDPQDTESEMYFPTEDFPAMHKLIGRWDGEKVVEVSNGG